MLFAKEAVAVAVVDKQRQKANKKMLMLVEDFLPFPDVRFASGTAEE